MSALVTHGTYNAPKETHNISETPKTHFLVSIKDPQKFDHKVHVNMYYVKKLLFNLCKEFLYG